MLVANRDRGVHVDPEMPASLAALKRQEARPLRLIVGLPDGIQKEYVARVDQILAASLRTIAEEVRFLFERQILPDCERRQRI